MAASIFINLNLPNAVTWFYLSLLLAIALFFKFTRLLSMRNLDVLALFLLVPGLLLRMEARADLSDARAKRAKLAELQAKANQIKETSAVGAFVPSEEGIHDLEEKIKRAEAWAPRLLWFSYVWLLLGSVYFLGRCLLDLALVRRPALSPNLNLGGLAWLGAALFICLVVISVQRPPDQLDSASRSSAALSEVQRRAANAVNRETGAGDWVTQLVIERTLAVCCQLAVAAALIFIGFRHFQDATSGVAMATFYLLLPYTSQHFEQAHHVWPVALLLWAIAAYRLPTVAGLLVGLAAGSLPFPVLTLPVWLGFYWGRGAGRFFGAFLLAAGLTLGIIGLILWTDGSLAQSLRSVLDLSDWQPVGRVATSEGFWTGVHWAYRFPVFIAYVALVITMAFWPSPKNLAHLIALSAAALIGIQFWFADKGGVYVLWYLPLLLLLTFRPNLSDRYPAAITPESDWLARFRRRLVRVARRWLRVPEPAAPVA